jgi:hypothetical protein
VERSKRRKKNNEVYAGGYVADEPRTLAWSGERGACVVCTCREGRKCAVESLLKDGGRLWRKRERGEG